MRITSKDDPKIQLDIIFEGQTAHVSTAGSRFITLQWPEEPCPPGRDLRVHECMAVEAALEKALGVASTRRREAVTAAVLKLGQGNSEEAGSPRPLEGDGRDSAADEKKFQAAKAEWLRIRPDLMDFATTGNVSPALEAYAAEHTTGTTALSPESDLSGVGEPAKSPIIFATEKKKGSGEIS